MSEPTAVKSSGAASDVSEGRLVGQIGVLVGCDAPVVVGAQAVPPRRARGMDGGRQMDTEGRCRRRGFCLYRRRVSINNAELLIDC